MSLSELRAELKSLRKSLNPVPASRMKKAAIAMEIARLKGTSAPPTTPEKEEKPKAVEPKAEKPKKEKAEKPKEEPEVKKTKGVRAAPAGAPAEVKVPTVKPAKGSEEMRARMAALREKRAKKAE
jgi:hypothetical protein